MITLEQYVGPHKGSYSWNPTKAVNAELLLEAVNSLEPLMEADGVIWKVNPSTGSQVSGKTYGGFRPQECPQGAPFSNHKQGKAVDIYDPDNEIDAWCKAHPRELERLGLYMEISDATPGWAHFQSVAPKSGNLFFYP